MRLLNGSTLLDDKTLYDDLEPETLSAVVKRDYGDRFALDAPAHQTCRVTGVGDKLAVVSRQIFSAPVKAQTTPGQSYHFTIRGRVSQGFDEDCELVVCAPGFRYDCDLPEGGFILHTGLNEGAVDQERLRQNLKTPRRGVTAMSVGANDLRHVFGLIDGFVGHDGYRFSRRALECWMGVFIAEIISITDQDLAGRDTPAFIAEIERFIDDRLHADFSTDDIVTTFSMTERKLHYWFKKQFGVAPATYIRKEKFARVRGELRQAAPHGTTVSEAAARWGFYEMGHFARQYRSLYGELPSETLARHDAGG